MTVRAAASRSAVTRSGARACVLRSSAIASRRTADSPDQRIRAHGQPRWRLTRSSVSSIRSGSSDDARLRRSLMHRERAVCVCCRGILWVRISHITLGLVPVICHRCNLGKCGRGETFGRASTPNQWGCYSRVNAAVLRFHGQR